MFEEISKSVRSYLYQRASSPLLGAFLFSWSLWNYRFLFVLLGTASASDKFLLIDTQIFVTFADYVVKGFVLPLATALIYIYLYPIPAAWVYEYTQKKRMKMQEIKCRIEDATPLTIAEARKIKQKLSELEAEYETEIARKDNKIKALSSALQAETERKEKNQSLAERLYPDHVIHQLQDGEKRIIALLAGDSEKISEDELIRGSGESPVRVRHYIDNLVKNGLIGDSFANNKRWIRLNDLGRTAAVKLNLDPKQSERISASRLGSVLK